MKTKLDLAHDWAMKHGQTKTVEDRSNTVVKAWDYADAMYEQQEEREIKSHDELKNNLVDSINTDFAKDLEELNQHRRNADWQPDWSQAPDDAVYWRESNWGQYMWLSENMDFINFAPSFHYQGDWKESLRKRPESK